MTLKFIGFTLEARQPVMNLFDKGQGHLATDNSHTVYIVTSERKVAQT